ncbi:phospholipase D/nuclease [Hesseltinella vesiculosa]|uniref:phospholipase D n=1 Tax=Hesseltinella vesiculosa TaxID=101127 RepID=A0A1X2G9M9_9FUNG|nr:phospholipase D/nuclease [Hesseltinella vesiculosa]
MFQRSFHDVAKKLKDKVLTEIHELTGQLLQDSTPEEEQDEVAALAKSHRHESFAPVRQNTKVKWFVDGHDYCWAVAEAIENAKESVFIEDWWLSPELYLRRPPNQFPEYRLDNLLKRKAEAGVRIFIVVYKEVKQAMTLDSRYTKDALQSLHPNIVVLRHPDHDVTGTFFWSHHEKFVVIDNQIAFLGGIDLCYGRWDTHSHPLADTHSGVPVGDIFPGQDYSNARVRDFDDVKNWDRYLIDKTTTPRMPWHDISLCVIGGPVLDVARHFCDRWNFVKSEKALDKENVPFLQPPLGGFTEKQTFSSPMTQGLLRAKSTRFRHATRGIRGTCRSQVLRSSAKWSSGIPLEHSIQTAYIRAITEARHYVYIENQFFITTTEDDPGYIIKNQIGAAIVQRIIRAHDEGDKFKVFVLMPLVPAFPADLATKEARDARAIMHYQYASICRGSKSIGEKLRRAGVNPDDYIRFYSLRSYDRINRKKLEEMMARAAGFTPSLSDMMEANVNETHIPGTNEQSNSRPAADSISRHAMHGGDIHREPWLSDYDHATYRNEHTDREESHAYVTELLYIHAKLLIADDRLVIMGSANLNDRSQCGDRDSEIALLVEDHDLIPSHMNGHPYEASRFAATLRRHLWKEHLGLLPHQDTGEVTQAMLPLPVPQLDQTGTLEDAMVLDPLSEDTLNLWNMTARQNTESFRTVFHCVPDDTVRNFDQYRSFYPDPTAIPLGHAHNKDMSTHEIRTELGRIRGHLVEFPMQFLEDEDLKADAMTLTLELYT